METGSTQNELIERQKKVSLSDMMTKSVSHVSQVVLKVRQSDIASGILNVLDHVEGSYSTVELFSSILSNSFQSARCEKVQI